MLHPGDLSPPARTRPLAVGTAFGGCAGLLHPAAGSVGVVMVGPFGLEALAIARGWHELAGRIAEAGYPVLRYDHPATGDSLDDPATDWAGWQDAVADAVAHLRAIAAVGPVILVGQGLGGTLALLAAPRIADVALVAALAPVVNGRRHLREQTALGALGGGGAMAGGFRMPDAVAEGLKQIDLGVHDLGTLPPVLVACRPDRADDAGLARRLGADDLPYPDHAAFVTDATSAVLPEATFAALLAGIVRRVPPVPLAAPPAPLPVATLAGPGYVEAAVRFGADGGLFGILTRPTEAAREIAVVVANAGRDGHVGWARHSVDTARALAAAGYVSLRIDLSGLGESTAPADAGELLYGERHQDDLLAAVAFLEAIGHGRCVLTGRCSGAFAALHAAHRSPAVIGIMPVNPLRIVWDPDESVAEALTADIRPLDALARRAFHPSILLRILTGRIALGPALARLAGRVAQRYPGLSIGKTRRLRTDAYALLRRLNGRGTRVAFVFSAGDAGLERLAGLFGRSFEGMKRLTRLSLTLVEGADHNLNQPDARRKVVAELVDFLKSLD